MSSTLPNLSRSIPVCPRGISGHRWVMFFTAGEPTIKLASGEHCRLFFKDGQQHNICEITLNDYVKGISSDEVPIRLTWTEIPEDGQIILHIDEPKGYTVL